MTTSHEDQVAAEVGEFYAAAAGRAATGRSCCEGDGFGAGFYSDDLLQELPDLAVKASMGCGNPFTVAELGEGDVVLDLGSGGGIDVLLSAKRVGPTGRAYGLDMTPEMLDLARRNADEAGAANVEFLQGRLDAIPLPDSSVDVVISNCVINLTADKTKVFAEIARVLRPSGRLGVTDVVADESVSAAQRAAAKWSSCAAGALSTSEYERGLGEAGLTDVSVDITHPVGDGFHSAIIRAIKHTPAL